MSRLSRRRFLQRTGAGLIAAATSPPLAATPAAGSTATAPRTSIRVAVNGVERSLEVEDRWTLAELLRDHLDLTGTKVGCDRGECGACTVLLDGRPVYGCSYLAVWADGLTVRTVEGLARGERLDPLQEAFVAEDGPQCGFCTPGQLMSARALLEGNARPTPDEVRAALSGNICRCGNYEHYVRAVLAAAAAGPGTRRG